MLPKWATEYKARKQVSTIMDCNPTNSRNGVMYRKLARMNLDISWEMPERVVTHAVMKASSSANQICGFWTKVLCYVSGVNTSNTH